MSKKYEIKTMADLAAAARSTTDVQGLALDLAEWLQCAVGLREFDLGPHVTFDDTEFVWVDDNERGVSAINVKIVKGK